MPCFLVVVALAAPRLVIVLVWFFSDWFSGLFPSPVFPVLGFLFLPTSLLWYSAVQHWFGAEWTLWPMVGIVIALLIDLSPAKGKRR